MWAANTIFLLYGRRYPEVCKSILQYIFRVFQSTNTRVPVLGLEILVQKCIAIYSKYTQYFNYMSDGSRSFKIPLTVIDYIIPPFSCDLNVRLPRLWLLLLYSCRRYFGGSAFVSAVLSYAKRRGERGQYPDIQQTSCCDLKPDWAAYQPLALGPTYFLNMRNSYRPVFRPAET